MLALYYAPGACSMAAHIVLEESGATYEAHRVDLANGEQRTDAYPKINPHGRVPVLKLDNRTPLAENTAILPYLAATIPGLAGRRTIAEEQHGLSLVGFFASSVHPAHAHIGRPERYAADSAAFPTIQETARKTFHTYLEQIDALLAGREWFSDRYTVLDPYGLVFYTWGVRRELPMAELANYTAFKERMVKRPRGRARVGEREDQGLSSPLVGDDLPPLHSELRLVGGQAQTDLTAGRRPSYSS